MTLDAAELKRRAKRRYRTIARRRADPRYQRVMARLATAKLLVTSEELPAYRGPISVKDALWAGEVEPRILELLPALIIKKPGLFDDAKALPDDLMEVVRALRRGETPSDLRGIPGVDLERWVPLVGHRGKRPARDRKSTRLNCSHRTVSRMPSSA